MKKKFIVLFLIVVCINNIFSKEILKGSGKLETKHSYSSVSLNDPNYSFCVSTSNEKSVVVNELTFVTEDDEIFITYDDAKIAAGDASGSFHYRTSLYIVDSKGNEIKNNPFSVEKNNPISIRIVSEYYLSGNLVEVKTLASTTIFSDYLIKESQENISFVNVDDNVKLISISGSLPGLLNDYSLSVSTATATGINSPNKNIWYVQKDTSITINYNSSRYSNNSSPYWSYAYTELRINGESCSSIPTNITEDMEIELFCVSADYTNPEPTDSLLNKKLYINVDNQTPTIKIAPANEGKEWIQKEVDVSVEEKETGIECFFVKKDGEEYKKSENEGAIHLEEDGKYLVTAIDLVGNKSEKEIWIDKTIPKITVNGETVKEDNLYTDSRVTIKAEDFGSGVAEFCVNGETISGDEYTVTQCGKYTIFVKDKAGNKITKEISIDNEPPVINGEIIFQQGENLLNGIAINTTVNEENAISWIKIKHNEEENKILTNKHTIEIEEREEFHTYQIQIGAKDKAGNQVEKELAVINVPPKIKVSVDEESKRIIKEKGEEYTATDLILDNYEKYAKYYKEIKLTKVIYVCDGESDKKIDDSNFNNYFSPEAQSYWQEITEEKVIRADEIKDGKYTDKIKTSSGFGHKTTGYILSWEIEGIDGIREESEEVKIETANSEGKVDVKIIGKEKDGESSVLDIDFINGKASCEEAEIEIPADGSIYIEYTIDDKDSEPYEIEVRQKVKEKGQEEILVSKEGFIHKGNTGYSIFNQEKEHSNVYREEQWNRFSNPEYLAYNKQTCLVIRVKEGYGSDAIDKELGEIYLKAEPLDLGGFRLLVCEEADYNYFGITASPFQKIQMEVEGKDSIQWDFGDGNKDNGKKIEHAWRQSPEREGAVSEYILTLTTKEKGVEVPIHIVDTKAGALYGDEEWIGEHEILGPVIVPAGKTLTIGKKTDSSEEINILCMEDTNEKYMGSIEVRDGGNIKINNGEGKVRLVAGENTSEGIVEETEEDISYWKGIRIKDGGEAEIENAEIMGSKRGVVVEKGASLVIKESLLSKNEIGLHVFGSCEIEDVEISENKEYGIKEENLCEVNIYGDSNKIRGNTVDWYDWNEGVLTEEEITNRE